MQKKKQTKPIKQIIIYTLLVLLVLLIVFAEDIIKLANKNKLALLENNPNEIAPAEPNPPHFVAGMIPIKWNGTNWIITTREDKDWYDYKSGKPAYVMLNDGYYRSEIERDVEDEQLMANAVGVGVPDDPSVQGTILMWIPRFAVNNETNDIKYIQGIEQADENWTIPDMFTHKQASETMPDFLLTGIWFEKDVDTNYANKIATMNTKDSIYGFIKNTIAVPSDKTTGNTIQKYIENNENTSDTVGASIARPQIDDITNPNRIILKILNQKNQDPIKAKASYNKDTGLIEVQVTYTQYGINKILYENTSELKLEKNGRQAQATSEGIDVKDGERTITIIDNNGNQKKIKVQVVSRIYATLYTDGTLAFGKTQNPLPEKTVSRPYGEVPAEGYLHGAGSIPWYNNSAVKTATFVDEIYITSTASFFDYCYYLTKVENMHNLKGVTDMSNMFNSCNALTDIDVSNLDTSKVTDMSNLFYNCTNLTKLDVSNWDTSNVTDMNTMFCWCSSLTELDVSNWNTSKVTNMQDIFHGCNSLIALDVSNWDTSKVTNMYGMFYECSNLTQLDVSNFDTSKVTNMAYMFSYCRNLTQLDVSNFDTSNVTNMTYMFYDCRNLTSLDLSSFDTSKVTNVNNILNNCPNLTQITFGEKWNKQVTLPSPSKEGYKCTGWYSDAEFTTKVAGVGASYTPTGPITIYANMSPLMYAALYTDSAETILAFGKTENPLASENKTPISTYGDITNTEYNANTLPWRNERENITTVEFVDEVFPTSTQTWFWQCSNLKSIENIKNLNTKNVANMSSMFMNCSSLTSLDLSNFDTSNVTNMHYMFSSCSELTSLDLSSFNTSNVTKMAGMFNNCSGLTSINLSSLDTSNVTDMRSMFSYCSGLTSIDLRSFNTSNVTDMSQMFSNCKKLTSLDLSPLDTSKVTNISYMFYNCIGLNNIDLSPLDTSSVINMAGMFGGCNGLTQLDLSPLNTTNVTNMNSMFIGCTSLTSLDLSPLDTSNVTNMGSMFVRCDGLIEIDVSNFDTRNTTDMSYMFANCKNLRTVYVGKNWVTDKANITDMFWNSNNINSVTPKS